MSGRRLFCLLGALALGLGLLTAPVAASGQQRPDADFPNLPERQNRVYGQELPVLASSFTTNVAFVPGAQQWVRSIDLKIATDVNLLNLARERNPGEAESQGVIRCRALYGQDSARCVRDRSELGIKNTLRALAYPTDFVGDDPAIGPGNDTSQMRRFDAGFDRFVSQRIRMVAFGALPAEATMDLSLGVDAGGLPRGIEVIADQWQRSPRDGGGLVISDSAGRAELTVRLRDLTVDGRRVDLGRTCQVTGQLSLRGRGYSATVNANLAPPGRYNPQSGGTLDGTLTVGSFTGCGTSGEDLSPLVNSVAGDSEIPLRAIQGRTNVFCFGDILSTPLRENQCNSGGPGPFPEGTDLPTLPEDDVPPAPGFD